MSTEKDYLLGDNSDIIATDSQKNTVYVLAKKFGIKSPEDFAILLCNHFLSKYSHVMKVVINVEEILWNRLSYGEKTPETLHNHAFVQTPICSRVTNVTWKRNGEIFQLSVQFHSLYIFRILPQCRQWNQETSCFEDDTKFVCEFRRR